MQAFHVTVQYHHLPCSHHDKSRCVLTGVHKIEVPWAHGTAPAAAKEICKQERCNSAGVASFVKRLSFWCSVQETGLPQGFAPCAAVFTNAALIVARLVIAGAYVQQNIMTLPMQN